MHDRTMPSKPIAHAQVLRRLAVISDRALEAHLPALAPSVCALLQSASGPTKLAAERTLARLLRVGMSTAIPCPALMMKISCVVSLFWLVKS